MKKLRSIFVIVLIMQVLFCFPLSAYAGQTVYFSLTAPKDTQAMTFGKDNNTIYILKVVKEKVNGELEMTSVVVQRYVNKVLKDERELWKKGSTSLPKPPSHPNGMTYYNSCLYIVAGEHRIFLLQLNADGSFGSRITCQMVDKNGNALTAKAKESVGIASVGNGTFIVRTRRVANSNTYNFGLYKFDKTNKKAIEMYTFSTSDLADSYKGGGQDIGYKKDSSGEYIFYVTSNKIEQSDGTNKCIANRVIKYKLNKNTSGHYTTPTYSKTIALNRPASSYDLFEVESVDFSSGGTMYFTGNERENTHNVDKVRYYHSDK